MFAALAVARVIEDTTGWSVKKFIKTARRYRTIQIQAGEPASYNSGSAFPLAQPGAQGFVGFAPVNAIKRHRQNGSIYLDLEAQVTDKFLVGIAGRGEDYSDFGTTGTGKVSLRYDFTPWFALRGTIFRLTSL